jgi:hypothetical protein
MLPLEFVAFAVLLLLPGDSLAIDRTIHQIPALPKRPKLDGNPKDFIPSTLIKSARDGNARSAFIGKVGYWDDTLYLRVDVQDANVIGGDILDISLHFPGAGTTARGYSYRFAPDGKRASDPETGAPAFASKRVQTSVRLTPGGSATEVAFPARSLPRFPFKHPMTLELCISYQDRDELAGPPTEISNCKDGAMREEVLQLPDAFRKRLRVKPALEVVALEGREHGWVGFAALHYLAWIHSDQPLTPEILASFFVERIEDPLQARIALPPRMRLPDGRPVLPVLTGQQPYAGDVRCDPAKELRLALYVVEGKTARRALDWPASSCSLGRASSVLLDEEGSLTIGYSGGATVNFVWSGDHFERTEIG